MARIAGVNIPDNKQVDIHYFGGMFWHAGKKDFKTTSL